MTNITYSAIINSENLKLGIGQEIFFQVINSCNYLPNYTYVIESRKSSDISYILSNVPSNEITRKCYCEIIYLAERRNSLHASTANNASRHIFISDITDILYRINKEYADKTCTIISIISSHNNPLEYEYLFNADNIECIYKFPVDNVYIAVSKCAPNVIYVLSSDAKFSKEALNKNVDNKTIN